MKKYFINQSTGRKETMNDNKVYLDVDGILRPFVEEAHKLIEDTYDVEVTEFNGTDFWSCFPIAKEVARQTIFKGGLRRIFLDSKPYKNAKNEFDFLKGWCDGKGYELIIVTSQVSYAQKLYTLQWLAKHELLVDNIAFLNFNNKALLRGLTLIDDDIRNLKAWEDANGITTATCYKRPWNESWKGITINSLEDIPNVL